MASDDFGNGGASGTPLQHNPAYVAAFNDLVAATTPQAKHAAMQRLEIAAAGGAAPAPAPSASPVAAPGAAVPLSESQAYRDTLAKTVAAPTPQGREHYIRQLEAMTLAATPAAEAAPAGPLEGFEPALSIGDLPLPPNLAAHVIDRAGFAAVQEAAVAVGIPKTVWGEALTQAADHLHLLKAPEADWNAQLDRTFAQLDRALGSPEARSAVVKDAAAFLKAVAEADPRLAEGADLMRLTPWGLTTAANLWRAGVRPGKR